jgi:hypothetical protein
MRASRGPDILGCHLSWRDQAGSRGDDERFVGSHQRIAHRLDGALVDLSVLRESREIVDEGKMDGAICLLRAFPQAIEILKGTAMDLGAQSLERFGIGIGAGKAEHGVPARDQFLGCGVTDESGRAGDEYPHETHSCSDERDVATLRIRVK